MVDILNKVINLQFLNETNKYWKTATALTTRLIILWQSIREYINTVKTGVNFALTCLITLHLRLTDLTWDGQVSHAICAISTVNSHWLFILTCLSTWPICCTYLTWGMFVSLCQLTCKYELKVPSWHVCQHRTYVVCHTNLRMEILWVIPVVWGG